MVIDPQDADKFFGEEWDKSLTTAEEISIYDYAGDGYKPINSALWATGGDVSKIDPNLTTDEGDRVVDEIRHIDSALAKGDLKQNIIVYRGDQGDIFDGLSALEIKHMMKGAIITNYGYSSASISEKSATAKAYQYNIKVKAGKGKGAFIRNQSPHYTEHEFLIRRNARLKVLDAYERPNGQIVVDMEML